MKKTKVITLFSGVGMQELGFDTAGLDYELINYCEFEKKPAKGFALFHNVSEDLNLGDITKVNEDDYFNKLVSEGNQDIDIMISSFPCQAFSAAGSRKGFDDPTRGTLFFDTMRLANKIKPSVLIFENVKGLTNHDGGNTLKVIEQKVLDSGYKIYYRILNSIYFDIPQNRERWFAVCIREDLDHGDFYFPNGEMTDKCVADFLESNINERKKTARMTPILADLLSGVKQKVNYKSNVGLIKVYDGIKQGDFKGGFTRTGIFSIYGTTPTLIKPNENHFLEINGRLTPKERMRLMGVDDKYTDRLINSGEFSEREIDAIAGNGLVVNVFDALIQEVYKYMGWIDGDNVNTDHIKKKVKIEKDLVETTEPSCETEFLVDTEDDDDFWG
jgi:DNA-cytosine methyltransferase